MMRIVSTQIIDMQSHACMIDEALEELVKEVDVEVTNPGPREGDIENKPWPPREIDDDTRQRFVQRNVGVAIPPHAHLVSHRLSKRLPDGDSDVLDRVVSVNFQITVGSNIQIDQSMSDHLIEHVIEEGHARL